MVFDHIFEEVKEFFYKNDFTKAIEFLDEKSELAKIQSDKFDYFAYQNKISELLFLNGAYQEASTQSNRLLRELEDFRDPKYAFIKNQIYQIHATARYYLGKYDESIEWAKLSLQNINTTSPKIEKCFIANGQIIIGKAHLKKGDLFESRKLLYRALKLFLEVFGPDHISVGRTMTYIGLLNLQFKNISVAERYIQRALSIFRGSELIQDHIYVGLSCLDMARCNFWRAELSIGDKRKNYLIEVKNYYTRAERIFKQLPQADAYLCAVYKGLGDMCKLIKKWDASLNYYNLELACRDKVLPSEHHPNISRTFNRKSEIYFQNKDYDASSRCAHLAIFSNVDGFTAAKDIRKNPIISLTNIDSPHELVTSLALKANLDKSRPVNFQAWPVIF